MSKKEKKNNIDINKPLLLGNKWRFWREKALKEDEWGKVDPLIEVGVFDTVQVKKNK
jgi:hypothetical protein